MRRNLPIGGPAVAAVFMAIAAPATAKTPRWASQGDILAFDPMAQNESLNNTFADDVHDGLGRYTRQFVPEPALAASWTRPESTRWRFVQRKGVRFHDGLPLAADDVVYSFERVLKASSNRKIYAQGVKEVKEVDEYAIDIATDGPKPVLCAAWSTSRS